MEGNYSTKIQTPVYVLKNDVLNKTDGDNQKAKQIGLIFSRSKRYSIFSFFVFITIIINLDNGYITAAIPNIQDDTSFEGGVSWLQIGLIGSVSFLGNIIGKQYYT